MHARRVVEGGQPPRGAFGPTGREVEGLINLAYSVFVENRIISVENGINVGEKYPLPLSVPSPSASVPFLILFLDFSIPFSYS